MAHRDAGGGAVHSIKSGMDQCDKKFKKIAVPTTRGPDNYQAN